MFWNFSTVTWNLACKSFTQVQIVYFCPLKNTVRLHHFPEEHMGIGLEKTTYVTERGLLLSHEYILCQMKGPQFLLLASLFVFFKCTQNIYNSPTSVCLTVQHWERSQGWFFWGGDLLLDKLYHWEKCSIRFWAQSDLLQVPSRPYPECTLHTDLQLCNMGISVMKYDFFTDTRGSDLQPHCNNELVPRYALMRQGLSFFWLFSRTLGTYIKQDFIIMNSFMQITIHSLRGQEAWAGTMEQIEIRTLHSLSTSQG